MLDAISGRTVHVVEAIGNLKVRVRVTSWRLLRELGLGTMSTSLKSNFVS